MSNENVFNFNDYDCVGFDLDNTICHFNVPELMKLVYDLLNDFLIDNKGYDPKYLLKPFDKITDSLQRGLFMDMELGNVLRIASDGTILKVCHGNELLSDEEIMECYGPDKMWDAAVSYSRDPLSTWNSDLESKIRSCLDFFDAPAAFCFANCVDAVDARSGPQNTYNIWADVLEGLVYMFTRENFMDCTSGFFFELKTKPEKYYNKCDESVMAWLKSMKKNKITFLISGSNADFASFTAQNSMGDNWMDLFDIVVFYARKPGFFTSDNPFVGVKNLEETVPIVIDHSNKSHVYSQGNWTELNKLLSHLSKKVSPKALYIGDNLVQDIYTPSKFGICDTVALVEEMAVTDKVAAFDEDPYVAVLSSQFWGSFFSTLNNNKQNIPSLWSKIISQHSKLCIPSLKAVSSNPIDFKYPTFTEHDCLSGFYPVVPNKLQA